MLKGDYYFIACTYICTYMHASCLDTVEHPDIGYLKGMDNINFYMRRQLIVVASYGKSHRSIYKIAVNSIQCILIHSYRLNREYVTCKIFYTLFICYRIVSSKWGGSCAHCVQRTLFCKDTIRTCCNPLTHYTKAIANCSCHGGAINYN